MVSNRGPSTYQPNALPLGQTGSQAFPCHAESIYSSTCYCHTTSAEIGVHSLHIQHTYFLCCMCQYFQMFLVHKMHSTELKLKGGQCLFFKQFGKGKTKPHKLAQKKRKKSNMPATTKTTHTPYIKVFSLCSYLIQSFLPCLVLLIF